MYCFCTLKSVKVARLFGAPTWAPADWMGHSLTICVYSEPCYTRIQTSSTQPVTHIIETAAHAGKGTHTRSHPSHENWWKHFGEREVCWPSRLTLHYTGHHSLSLSLSLSSATGDDDLICSYVFLFRMCKTREPVVMVTHGLNWPSYRLAFLHVSSFPDGIFFSLLLVHLHNKSLAHSGHYVELM